MNMVRVWGGGIYEQDVFYKTCDELGIMIWHDFMFACGNYPAMPWFLRSVEREAREQLIRLRCHPSIVIWAGNNEDYSIAEQEGLTYRPNDKEPSEWLKTDFPARYIYEYLLPNQIEEFSPSTPYIPGSPFSGKDPRTGQYSGSNNPDVGDVHQWDVWHGSQKPYQAYGELGGRFVSEFGMLAYPSMSTLRTLLPDHEQAGNTARSLLSPHSALLDFHTRATTGAGKLSHYLGENLPLPPSTDLRTFTFHTQLLQAEAVSYASVMATPMDSS